MKKQHINPGVTVNWVITKGNKILLQRRAKPPFENRWEIGGGFVNYGETVEDALIREVKEETGFDIEPEEIIGVYSDPKRDPRKHSISIFFAVKIIGGKLRINKEVKEFKWFQKNEIDFNSLGFDHAKIIKDYLKWKKNKGTYWSTKGP